MPQWKKKDPGRFPPAFHDAMRFGPGHHVITRAHTKAGAVRLQVEWQLFRFCLRSYPTHPTSAFEASFHRLTKIGWNAEVERWELRVHVRENLLDMIDRATNLHDFD